MDLLKRRRMMMGRKGGGYETMPLTFDILSDGDITWKFGFGSVQKTIEYSKNGGVWTPITSTSAGATISVVAGDEVRFRGSGVWPGSGVNNFSKFSTTCSFSVRGNPASFYYGERLSGNEVLTVPGAFYELFRDCTGLVDASSLALPFASLLVEDYGGMFRGCTSLVSPPELPATELGISCYNSMFRGCSSLIYAPKLPATELQQSCYQNMFSDCKALLEAPELPATELGISCYNSMFSGCSSLIYAPELLATELKAQCYYYMFQLCSNLTQILCLATDISEPSATAYWVQFVGSGGTFYKKAGVAWPSGSSGIPDGWTVIEV